MAEFVSGNMFVRTGQMWKAGEVVNSHTHNFDHNTIVFQGAIRVEATLPDGREIVEEFVAPAWFLVKKEVIHRITALVDGTVYWCVFCHRDPQTGEVVQAWNGWKEATY